MTLKELCKKNKYSTDKESTHHYLSVYEELFAPVKHKEITLLELGYATGGSIQLWEDYFDKAKIICIDKDGSNFLKHSDRVTLHEKDLYGIEPGFFDIPIDIAIDDGSHLIQDQIRFIELIWPVLNSGGMIIIEDVFDFEHAKRWFEDLNIPFYIVDLRCYSNHYDNVLIIYRKW